MEGPIRQTPRDKMPNGSGRIISSFEQRKLDKDGLRLAMKVYETAQEGVMITNTEGIVQFVNPAFTQITGYGAEEAVGKNLRDFNLGHLTKQFYGNIRSGIRKTGQWQGEVRSYHKSGEEYSMWLTVSAIRNDAGAITHYVSVFTDISELKRMETQLHLVSKVIENTMEGVMIADIHGSIQLVNPAFTVITGYGPDEVLGKNPRILNSGRHDAEFFVNMWASIHETGQWQGEIWNRRKDGEIYPEWLHISAIRDENGKITHYAAVFSDISERKRYEDRLAYQAYYDVLTGLPNRALLKDRLEHELDYAKRKKRMLAVLFIDIDRFKSINDSLGPAFGDRLLRAIAERLKSCVHESDTVARLSGDEFALLLTGINSEKDVVKGVLALNEAFRHPLPVDGYDFFITTSIGISLYPTDGSDMETLIKNADTAMYRSKEQGGNQYQFYLPEMNAKAAERLELETDLRRALERNEMVLYYQPKVDLQSGRIAGMEALIRWQHPERGMVSPAKFISLAEETGLIIPIGEWALRTACRQNKVWQTAGFPAVRVAVNLSARQFQQEDLVQTVERVLRETDLDPNDLELEITESVAMQDVERASSTLKKLKNLGVRISIDDFGLGYSSLGYLKKFPIDTLKIDQSFVRDIATDSYNAAIVTAVITLARSLNLKVVAEGVESREQQLFLQALQCDEMQGYLFSRPVPASSFEKLLAETGQGESSKTD